MCHLLFLLYLSVTQVPVFSEGVFPLTSTHVPNQATVSFPGLEVWAGSVWVGPGFYCSCSQLMSLFWWLFLPLDGSEISQNVKRTQGVACSTCPALDGPNPNTENKPAMHWCGPLTSRHPPWRITRFWVPNYIHPGNDAR